MHVRVNATRKDMESARVELVGVFIQVPSNFSDPAISDRDVHVLDTASGDDVSAADDWKTQWISGVFDSRPRRGRRPARSRLRLECLEDRAVPATFTVTTALDVVDPADGRLSLREANRKLGLLPEEEFDRLLRPEAMTHP